MEGTAAHSASLPGGGGGGEDAEEWTKDVAAYYTNYFPIATVEKFYTQIGPLNMREFAFEGTWKRFGVVSALDLIKALQTYPRPSNPESVSDRYGAYHVGPVYSESYSYLHSSVESDARPGYQRAKEFVIDIDLTDMTTQRETCGCGAAKTALCVACWIWVSWSMHVAERTLQLVLSESDVPVMWAFSGGRGMHGYVVDQYSDFTTTQRRKIVDQLGEPANMEHDKEFWRTTQNRLDEVGYPIGQDDPPPPFIFDRPVTWKMGLTRGIFSPHKSGFVTTPVTPEQVASTTIPRELIPSMRDLRINGPHGASARLLTDATHVVDNYIQRITQQQLQRQG
jgi:hypothetical protein